MLLRKLSDFSRCKNTKMLNSIVSNNGMRRLINLTKCNNTSANFVNLNTKNCISRVELLILTVH